MAEDYLTDYDKWYRLAYEQRYGKEREKEERHGFKEYRKFFKIYWSDELSVGVFEREGKFIACLVAKEVVDKESFILRFGLSFEKDVQWKATSSLLDHLSSSPLFKAVLITMNKIPIRLEPDVSGELRGRLNWAKRNYEYHKGKAEALKHQIEAQSIQDFSQVSTKADEGRARSCKVFSGYNQNHGATDARTFKALFCD